MFDSKIPKYSKIEIKVRDNKGAWDDGFKKSVPNTMKVETFEDAGLVITGNFLVVVIDEKTAEDTLSSTGKIFNLLDVVSYKTHNQ